MNKPIFKLIALNLVVLLILSFPFYMPQSVNPFVLKAHALDLSTYGQIRLYEGHNDITKSGNVFFSTTQKGAYSITISTGGGLTLYDVESEAQITPIYTKSVNGESSTAIYSFIKNQTVMIFANDSWTSRKVDITRASETKYPALDKGFYALATDDDLKLYGYNTTVIDENGNVLTPTDKFYYTEGNDTPYYIFVNEQNSKYADGFTKYFKTDEPIPEFIYKTNAGGAEVYDYLGDNDNVEIPNSLGGKPVTVLQKGAFEGIDVNSIILPNTMTTIKTGAFELVENINYLGIPSSVDIIETDVFKNVNIGHIYCEDSQSTFTNQYDNGRVPECATTHFDCEYYDGFEINYDEEYCDVIHYDCYSCSGGNFTRDFGDGSKHDVIQLGVYEESKCNYQGSAYGECNDCGAYLNYYLDLADCAFENYVSNNDATCQKNATETGKCKWCEAPDTREIANSKVAHKFENYVSNNDATCQKNATETGKCKWCEAPDTREIPDSKAEHKFENYVSNNDATCQKNATETGKCKWCEAPDTREIPDSKVAHKFENYVSNNDATCQKNATETGKCKWCEAPDTREIPDTKAEHKFGEYKSDNNATCCKDGTTTAKCKWCDETDSKGVENSALGHTDTSKIFTDIKAGKWYSNAIDYAYTHGFIAGVSETEFGRDVPVTRGMFITILARIAGVDTGKEANKTSTKFTDVKSGKYYTAAIKWASENNIVSGVSDTAYGPDTAIERQQLCTMIVNFAKHQNITITEVEAAIDFADKSSIAKYAKDNVSICQKADIVNGYANGDGFDFRPKNTVTRAEAAQILYKFHKDFVAK